MLRPRLLVRAHLPATAHLPRINARAHMQMKSKRGTHHGPLPKADPNAVIESLVAGSEEEDEVRMRAICSLLAHDSFQRLMGNGRCTAVRLVPYMTSPSLESIK